MRIMQEVIRIEPRAESAWRVLAQCHEDAGNSERALLMRVMAAHLSNDPEEWDALAERSRWVPYDFSLQVVESIIYAETLASINRPCTVTGSCIISTLQTQTRFGIVLLWPKR